MAKVIDADVLMVETEDRLDGSHLETALNNMSPIDRERIFAIIATAGTTNSGIIDDLAGIADVCGKFGLWFHVDVAYGARSASMPL